ncbi:hypothetical protein [Brachybacterium hainanense]|uniref:Uncharacterized protein n=1 Tax=Brachybacterium hainanense TaxID=1541174 RepID=A0ABV6RCY0_9MICO
MSADVDADRGRRTLLGQLRDLRPVPTPCVQDRESRDIADEFALRRPLDEAVERVLPGSRSLITG